MLTDADRQRILVATRNMVQLRARLAALVRRGNMTDKSLAAAMQKAEAKFMDFLKDELAPAEVEWQIRGRHHYEWRKTTEALAAEMHRVNPLHVRAVTVLPGLVPKGQ